MTSYCFVVNPASRGGKNRRFLTSLQVWVEKNLPEARWFVTEGPGHAAVLAARAAEAGCARVISVGGDGTLHEVVNGLAPLPEQQRPEVGMLSSGTGGDFARTLKEMFPFPAGFVWLRNPASWRIDLGRAKLENAAGVQSLHYFVNIADVGISGEVTRRVNASRKTLGSLEYLRSTLAATWTFRAPRVRVDGEELDLLLLVVANGRYFGGGMCIAPDARLDDQAFQVMVAEKIPYLTLLRELPKIYLKKRFAHPKIRYLRGAGISVESSADLPIGMDGEYFAARRARFEIVPKALTVLVPFFSNPKS
jgi:YegS/Rv2252/BmrU family lipid kinase